MYEQILYDVDDPVATVTLNRPDRLNAWTDRMAAEVRHAMAQAEADERVVAIVLTGAGRGFCAGADLQNLRAISVGEGQNADLPEALAADPGDPGMDAGFHKHYAYLLALRKPVIAAVNGPCAGMAVPIACFADMRFASDRATFTTAFVRRGLIAEWGISWVLPRLVGHAHANDLLFSGRRIGAAEAERMGLVNRVVPHDELLKHTREYAVDLATHASPASIAVMKREVYEHLSATLGASMDDAVRLMVESFRRPDFREGVKSFLEKRPPRFPRLKIDS